MPVFTVPYLGYVADYIQHPPGTYVALSGGAVLLLLAILPDLLSGDKKGAQKKKKGLYTEPRRAESGDQEPPQRPE